MWVPAEGQHSVGCGSVRNRASLLPTSWAKLRDRSSKTRCGGRGCRAEEGEASGAGGGVRVGCRRGLQSMHRCSLHGSHPIAHRSGERGLYEAGVGSQGTGGGSR